MLITTLPYDYALLLDGDRVRRTRPRPAGTRRRRRAA